MKGLPSATALVCASAVLLAGCGGGGGGSNNPPPTPSSHTVSVTVSGLQGTGLVLRNNGTENLPVSANGSASFVTLLSNGAAYAVTVGTQPSSPFQTCTVSNGSGTVSSANVNISVACTTNRYTVSANVSGLAGSGLMLMQGTDELEVSTNGSIPFPTQVESASAYDVRIARQPVSPNQRCSVVGSGAGAVTNAPASVTIQCVDHVPRFAYTIDFDHSSISMYAVDAASGQLRPRGHVRTGLNPVMLFPEPLQQRFWFTLNRGDATISVFRQDAVTSELSEVGDPYPTGGTGGDENIAPTHLVIHPSSNFVYVVNGAAADNVAAFTLDQTTGVLTPVPGSPFAVGADPSWLKIDPTGRFAYVSHRGTGEIRIYSVSSTGALAEIAAGSRVATGVTPGLLAFTSNRRFAYVTNAGSNTLSAFAVDASTGALTPVAGSPFATGATPSFITVMHPSDRFLYAHGVGATDANGVLSAFSINQSTGVLTPVGAPAGVGANSTRAVVDASGKFLLVANRGAPLAAPTNGSISAFRIDQSTGELSALPGIPNVLPFNIDIDPSSQFVYVTSTRDSTQTAYTLDSTTGALTRLSRGATVATRKVPFVLQVHSSVRRPTAATFRSKFAYVTNRGSGHISSYATDSASGALAETGALATLTAPRFAAVHPRGRYLIVGDTDGVPGIASYPIDPDAGTLSAATGSIATLPGTTKVVVSAGGRNVYALNESASEVRGFALAPDGTLTNLPSLNAISTGTAGTDLSISPTDRFLNFLTATSQGRAQLDSQTGGMDNVMSANVAPGQLLQLINPQGTVAYIARSGAADGSVETLQVLTTGELVPVGSPVVVANTPSAMALDPSGRALYVASDSNTISQFAINPSDGTLTQLDLPVATTSSPTSLATDYSGKFLYVLTPADNAVLTFGIDAAGRLSALGVTPAPTRVGPAHVVATSDIE